MYQQYRYTILAAILAALWIATPLLAVVHIALDSHTYCAEHGILEEGVTHHDTSDASRQAPSGAAADASTEGFPNDSGHTPCGFGDTATLDSIHLGHIPTIKAAPIALSIDAYFSGQYAGDSQPPLVFAPKTSPPALT